MFVKQLVTRTMLDKLVWKCEPLDPSMFHPMPLHEFKHFGSKTTGEHVFFNRKRERRLLQDTEDQPAIERLCEPKIANHRTNPLGR